MAFECDSRNMLNLIHGDNGFQMDREVKQYLERERYDDRNGLGRQYYDHVIQRYNDIQNSAPVRTAKALYRQLVNRVVNVFDNNIVRLNTISRMQNPPPVMFKYLVANPTVRNLMYKDRIVGYREEYNDPYGKDMDPQYNREYRNVVNGIYQKEGDKYVVTRYYETTGNISTLSIDEQLDIFYSWNNIEHQLKTGRDDPTDKDNGSL